MFCQNGDGHSEVCSCVSMKVLPRLLGINAAYWVTQQKRKNKTDVCYGLFQLVFLRRNKKGVTTLNILNPENEGIGTYT